MIIIGKAAIYSKTILSILALIVTAFGPGLVEVFANGRIPTWPELLMALVGGVAGYNGIRGRISTTQPITSVLTPNVSTVVEKPMTYVKGCASIQALLLLGISSALIALLGCTTQQQGPSACERELTTSKLSEQSCLVRESRLSAWKSCVQKQNPNISTWCGDGLDR